MADKKEQITIDKTKLHPTMVENIEDVKHYLNTIDDYDTIDVFLDCMYEDMSYVSFLHIVKYFEGYKIRNKYYYLISLRELMWLDEDDDERKIAALFQNHLQPLEFRELAELLVIVSYDDYMKHISEYLYDMSYVTMSMIKRFIEADILSVEEVEEALEADCSDVQLRLYGHVYTRFINEGKLEGIEQLKRLVKTRFEYDHVRFLGDSIAKCHFSLKNIFDYFGERVVNHSITQIEYIYRIIRFISIERGNVLTKYLGPSKLYSMSEQRLELIIKHLKSMSKFKAVILSKTNTVSDKTAEILLSLHDFYVTNLPEYDLDAFFEKHPKIDESTLDTLLRNLRPISEADKSLGIATRKDIFTRAIDLNIPTEYIKCMTKLSDIQVFHIVDLVSRGVPIEKIAKYTKMLHVEMDNPENIVKLRNIMLTMHKLKDEGLNINDYTRKQQ